MKTDKADQSKTILPTEWSQLATPFFREDARLVTGIIGSMWHGLLHRTHHVRTLFKDCGQGSEMQCSHVLLNLMEAVVEEGHLPEEFYIGADNTPKETKNMIFCHFIVWLLCVLHDTCLSTIHMTFLLVGHTHDALDRFFSRFMTALAGHNYWTRDEMFKVVQKALHNYTLKHSHLGQVWRVYT